LIGRRHTDITHTIHGGEPETSVTDETHRIIVQRLLDATHASTASSPAGVAARLPLEAVRSDDTPIGESALSGLYQQPQHLENDLAL